MAQHRVEAEIERLSNLRDAPRAEAGAALRKALAHRTNLVVAKAAKMAAELERNELVPDLLRAFDRLMEDAAARDPQCWGKNAIAKALIELGHSDSAVFLRGARHVQMEPVWGKHEDMAPNLRAICVLALPACGDLRREEILRHLVDSLSDGAANVRTDAVRALEQMEGEESALLLRLKAHLGDEEAPVVGQVFESLLKLEGERAVRFVEGFLEGGSRPVREEAALALGIARLESGFEALRRAFEASRDAEFRAVILRALATSRLEGAIEFLRTQMTEGRPADQAAAREALALLGDPTLLSTPAPPSR